MILRASIDASGVQQHCPYFCKSIISESDEDREMAELDEALGMTFVDWRYIKQIVSQEVWVENLFNSLERLLKVPRVPLYIIRYILRLMEETAGDNSIYVKDVTQFVHDIWYSVLVNRKSGAPRHFFSDD